MRYTRDKILENKRKAEGQKELVEVFADVIKKNAPKKEAKTNAVKK
jgi:hypothetical protein